MMNMVNALFTFNGYYTYCEVTEGFYYSNPDRAFKKFDTTIHKALYYTMNNDVLSHMCLQKYNSKLGDRPSRNPSMEPSYFPFVIEFEPPKDIDPKSKKFLEEYNNALQEAYRYYNYLIYQLNVDPDDIVVFLSPKRSIYIYINPRVFGAKPSIELHKFYEEMFNMIDEQLQLNRKYLDISYFKSYQLIKTPNCQYYGGYVVHISDAEFRQLVKQPELRKDFTRFKRPLNRQLPCNKSIALENMFQTAREIVWANKRKPKKALSKKQKEQLKNNGCACLRYINQKNNIKGHRNFFLTSNAIMLKNQGFSLTESTGILEEIAERWSYEEKQNVKSIVRTVFKNDTSFSCKKIRLQYPEINQQCANCIYNKDLHTIPGHFSVHKNILLNLIESKANLRHYKVYLLLSRKGLLRNVSFDPDAEGIKIRDIKELVKYSDDSLILHVEKNLLRIENKASEGVFYVPDEFIDRDTYHELGSRLKHYLALFCVAWRKKSTEGQKYIYFRLSKSAIMELLQLTCESSFYKMLKDLEELGLLEQIDNGFARLYYRDYRIIQIQEYKELKEVKKEQNLVKSGALEGQISIDEFLCVIGEGILSKKSYRFSKKERKRGSPG